MASVSVIIPVFQGAKTIRAALDSVLTQTVPVSEIIVIDDGSTDNLEEVLIPYRNKIHFLKQKNSGSATARNLGLKQAKSEFVAFLDVDDQWLPQKLEKQLPLFQDKNVGVVYGNAHYLYQSQIQEKTYFDLYPPQKGSVFIPLFIRDFIPMPSVIVRRQILKNIGGFDERIRQSEDYDLLLRLSLNCDFSYVPDPIVVYQISENQKSKSYIRGAESAIKIKEQIMSCCAGRLNERERDLLQKALFKKYLRLSLCYLRDGRNKDAQKTLTLSKRLKGKNFFYWRLPFQVLSFLPPVISRQIIKVWDQIYRKPEYGFG